ncbi:MAG: STAS domain-containing protein [Vicinamibacterales bacterium]
MRITERQFGDVVVLDLHGAIAGYKAAGELECAVRRHCRNSIGAVVANLGGVRSVDVSGLAALFEAQTTLRRDGGNFKLAGITTRIHDLIVITRLLTMFDAYDSVEEALGRAMPMAADLNFSTGSLPPLGAS